MENNNPVVPWYVLQRHSEEISEFIEEYGFQIVDKKPGRPRKGIKIKYHPDPEKMGEKLVWKYFRSILREVDDSMVNDHVWLYYQGPVKDVVVGAIEGRLKEHNRYR